MVEILQPAEGDESPLLVSKHPVTRVYCDAEGIVCYERDGASPIRLNQVSPRRSRVEALRRCVALLESIPDEYSPERDFPISTTGIGISYNQLKMQTYQSCMKSREVETQRAELFKKKERKRR